MKHIIPPKLNEKFLVFGCTIPELAVAGALLLIGIFAGNLFFLAAAALVFVSSIRFLENEQNGRDMIRRTWNYYFKTQIFSMLKKEEAYDGKTDRHKKSD